MDKYEYKIRAEEINALIAEGKYAEAVQIADTIDWRRVKSVMMLCKISDLYKINRRYQESRDILLLAYEKHPSGRLILYSLCELSIKLSDTTGDEYVQALKYYREFVEIAPNDTSRYILQYRLYEAQDVSLEERIAVLEEFKKRDYREKWAYELAYLYHRIGLTTKCVEECDEMFLWFGEGKYVIKALELKRLHEPLNEDQQEKYALWMQARETKEEPYETEAPEEDRDQEETSQEAYSYSDEGYAAEEEETGYGRSVADAPTTELPEVKTVDVGQYNTINLQMALAESMREILDEDEPSEQEISEEEQFHKQEMPVEEDSPDVSLAVQNEEDHVQEAQETEAKDEKEDSTELVEETAIIEEPSGKTAAVVDFATRKEAKNPENTVIDEEIQDSKWNAADSVPVEPAAETDAVSPEEEIIQEEDPYEPDDDAITKSLIAPLLQETIRLPDPKEVEKKLHQKDTAVFDAQQILEQMKKEAQRKAEEVERRRAAEAAGVLTPLNTKPSKYDSLLSQEYDGQISLVMPEAERVEKQITGQLSIEDIMAEWEEMKKTNEQKRMEDVRQRILEHTGDLFANFDEATKNGLLEELERAFVAAIMKESGKKLPIKKVILPDDTDKKASSKRIQPEPEETEEETEEILSEDEVYDEEGQLEETEEAVSEEEISDEPEEEPVAEEEHAESDAARSRELTEEERELFGEFIHHRKTERQLVHTLDNMSLAPYTGNVLVTGEEEETTLTLAKALIREMQLNDNNFSGKVAKISAAVLNKKDIEETFGKLDNGALIIESASRLKPQTAAKMVKALDRENRGLLVLMIDRKAKINELLEKNPALKDHFNLRMDIEALDDEALVAYAKQYAEEMEYSIDEFGILALHTRIADMQTSDHEVNMAEVRDLVDEAIYYANKKTPGHFMDILLAKRYNEEDMIVLREKDFMHY